MPRPPVKGGAPISAPQQGGHALTPTTPHLARHHISSNQGEGKDLACQGWSGAEKAEKWGSLVVLVVLVILVARQSGPVHGPHHLQGSLRVGNLVTEQGVSPTPSHHAITDTVPGR